MRLENKQNEKARFSPQISGVIVLHRNMVSPQMVSPQNGVTRGGPPPPPPLATPLTLFKLIFGQKMLRFWKVTFGNLKIKKHPLNLQLQIFRSYF